MGQVKQQLLGPKYEGDKPVCPACGGPVEAEFVDIGVGSEQCGPYSCEKCHWVQAIPPLDDPDGLPPL